ncbi:MAG TPA: hypothetical protein ENH38_01460, partial [Nitrospirae bacterium]|nr:hypothetical protein [Nitrospirota bacterium]
MRLDILKAVLLILVFLLTAPVFAAGGDLRDMEDSLRNDPANPEIAINVALGYCDGGEMARCLDAMAYVIALDPSYVSQCKKYLERYGYSLNEDELREDSVGEAVDMIDAEIQLFRYDRMREPDDKDIEKIL